jgi:hypothetical protein
MGEEMKYKHYQRQWLSMLYDQHLPSELTGLINEK